MNPKANSRWYHAFFPWLLAVGKLAGADVVKFTNNDRSGCSIGDFVEKGQNFRRFLRMLCELSGTVINRSEIGRSLAASEAAVRDYLDLAEGTFLWRSIGSLEKTASKSPW